ncbi:phosphodiester glycosidase family protein [uncultured Sulfitobacter sp.]|uniref:phosphodiester glycosidase family protein n=1 Tax=uncultured Sulfitobacter sp. TaxID=191468 RepID=UPI00262F0D68|nr:phosphodiester glycosidase family protein [uncultured Sulfitobacter sp.]
MLAQPALAATCREETYEGVEYAICDVDVTQEVLRLFLYDDSGTRPYGYFSTLNAALEDQGYALGFAANAGMYHDDRAPVGLYIEDGATAQKIITNAGPGNFGLLPNGVLCLRDHRADVIETLRFVEEAPDCTSATQSGPMLVIDGELHPRFLRDSTSRFIRNGVGTSRDGTIATFVISNGPVTFHTFGSLFRDYLDLDNALYFDGNVSRLRAPELGRNDIGFGALGPIIGVVEGQRLPPPPLEDPYAE